MNNNVVTGPRADLLRVYLEFVQRLYRQVNNDKICCSTISDTGRYKTECHLCFEGRLLRPDQCFNMVDVVAVAAASIDRYLTTKTDNESIYHEPAGLRTMGYINALHWHDLITGYVEIVFFSFFS